MTVAPRNRQEERFAEEVLRRVLGIEVTQRDDGSAHRMVDALFRLPDGREGALEVTTLAEREALEGEAIAAKTPWHVGGSTWEWRVRGRGVLRRLERHSATLVGACESHGVTDPWDLPPENHASEAFEWFADSGFSMRGFPETKRPGAIYVLPDGGGGAVYEHLDGLPQWLAGRLRERDLAAKIEKLRSTGRDELHLFLRIHQTAMPFCLYDPLACGDCVPTTPLDSSLELTGLWLAPGWKNPILWWGATGGWSRADCLD